MAQRRGIAKALLDEVFERTRDAARRGFTLEVRASNDAAMQLYEAMGFRAQGVRRGYYTDNREDAVIMWREAVPEASAVILGLETSCDETAAALVTRDGDVLANVVASQAELHAPFGGVVPEVAARRHLELVAPVVEEALDDADATLDDVELVAVTRGPGPVGALLVGLSAAKALAWGLSLPLAPVDHLHGHVASLFLRPSRSSRPSYACSRPAGTRWCST